MSLIENSGLMNQNYTEDQLAAHELRLALARAIWRAEIGPNHGFNALELENEFQSVKDAKVQLVLGTLKHLENLGYRVIRTRE